MQSVCVPLIDHSQQPIKMHTEATLYGEIPVSVRRSLLVVHLPAAARCPVESS